MELAVGLGRLLPSGQVSTAGPQAFRDLLSMLVARYGTKEALGKKIKMTGSRVGRAIRGEYTFNTLNCLKLAEATGESATTILRAAGKDEFADLIERLYGQNRPVLTPAARALLDKWEALDPRDRASLEGIITSLADKRNEERASSAGSFRSTASARQKPKTPRPRPASSG